MTTNSVSSMPPIAPLPPDGMDAVAARLLALNPAPPLLEVSCRNVMANGETFFNTGLFIGDLEGCTSVLLELLASYLRFGWAIEYSPFPTGSPSLKVTMEVKPCPTFSNSNNRVIHFIVSPTL